MADGGLGLQDYSLLASGGLLTTATLGLGFRNGNPRGLGDATGYLGGRHRDVVMARKVTGQTSLAKYYNKLTVSRPGLAAYAPSLSHLSPSRYLNLWSTLAGHEGAIKGATMFANTERVMSRMAGDYGPNLNRVFGDLPMTSYRGSAGTRMMDMFANHPIGNLAGETWGQVFDESDSMSLYNRMRRTQNLATGAENVIYRKGAAEDIVRATGSSRGKVGGAISSFLVDKIAVKQNRFMIGMGKALPGMARVGGAGAIAIDLYGLGLMFGSMGGKLFINQLNAPLNRFKAASAEIHRGTFMSSSYISSNVGATGRQRAMANIYEKQLNLRQVLGNEAAMMGMM